MTPVLKLTLLASSLFTALMAGLFYAYSVSVNGGLARLDDTAYLKAMQNINRVILNPWFFISFMGALIVLPVCTYLHYRYGVSQNYTHLLLAATITYVAGTFGVTIFGNVPLNEALDKFNMASATVDEIRLQRQRFEIPWNKLNLIRTIFAILSFLLVAVFSIIKR